MKKFLGIIAIAAVVTTAGWNFSQSQNEVDLSDLALANVEALALGEGAFDCIPHCTASSISDCLVYSDGYLNQICFYFRARI